ncbi:abortive infection protein [Desulfuribacillus stibiiarsenatis]|uniref:Abortive infection protein n=2 Tax=Desulfuribacillus stibiiarsenatis TaxID=1390249 RepID=A0A1E5LAA0_9FIRM|nr:abortive infection protein [Desulfuribacillus stibiiarsenatis]
MAIPMIVSIFLLKIVYKEPLRKSLGISFRWNRWFVVAWFLPIILVFLTLGVSMLIPGIVITPGMEEMFAKYEGLIPPDQLELLKEQIASLPIHVFWFGILQGLVAGITVNAVAAFGEEAGWRGFLQREFADLGFWQSSLVIGIIWGFWHAPLILQGHNYPEHPVAGVFMMVVFTVLLSPLISYVRLKARSVIAAAIMHGTINGTVALAVIMVSGGTDLLVGVTGLAGLVALGFMNIVLWIYDRKFAKEPIQVKAC